MAPIWSDAIAEAKWERERRNRPAGDLLFGVDDATLGEILGIVALFNSTNALADGYQIEPDVLPEV